MLDTGDMSVLTGDMSEGKTKGIDWSSLRVKRVSFITPSSSKIL